jgi:GTP-binding protein
MIDLVKLQINAGNGGNGCVSFRREKYIPRGGPDGGDGGNGGSAYICGDPSINTLLHMQFQSTIYVERGRHGKGKNQRGSNGTDTVIRVPLGTVVWRLNPNGEKTLLADLMDTDLQVVARGGRGGWGNKRYVTPTNREPLLAQTGESGEAVRLVLELKMLADVGVIAQPNAGKSTLLTYCSEASPRIADYPFTTVEPVLGVVRTDWKRFVMMEVPGLIAGAHEGVGLGHQFLRHAERARIYLHLIDGLSDDPIGDFRMINQELNLFNPVLSAKPRVVAVNKIDILEVRERITSLEGPLLQAINETQPVGVAYQNTPLFFVSAATGEGVAEMLAEVVSILDGLPKEEPSLHTQKASPTRTSRRSPPDNVHVQNGVYVVKSVEVERLVALADVRDYRVRLQLWRVMNQRGVVQQLEEAGIRVGDTIRIGRVEMEWS